MVRHWTLAPTFVGSNPIASVFYKNFLPCQLGFDRVLGCLTGETIPFFKSQQTNRREVLIKNLVKFVKIVIFFLFMYK